MDVKPPIAQIPNSALTKYRPHTQILQRINIPSSPVFPEDIVDFVKIETVKPAPAYTQIVKYKSLSNDPINEKGMFIDILI
jgi:hypothetical protein